MLSIQESKLITARISHLYRYVTILLAAAVVYLPFLFMVFLESHSLSLLLSWLSGHSIVLVFRAYLLLNQRKKFLSQNFQLKDLLLHQINALLSSLSWCFAIYLVTVKTPEARDWLILLGFSLIISSYLAYATFKSTLLTSLLPAPVGLAALVLLNTNWPLAVLMLVFIMFSIFVALSGLAIHRLTCQALAFVMLNQDMTQPQTEDVLNEYTGSNATSLEEENTTLKSELDVAKKRLHHFKQHALTGQIDMLTGLANRSNMFLQLPNMLKTAHSTQAQLSLFHINIDRFKAANDLFGHHIGDTIIQELSQRLSLATPDQGLLFRIGGDEFICAIYHQHIVSPVQHAERILSAINRPMLVPQGEIILTASIGISNFPKQAEGLKALILQADLAMTNAKHLGGNLAYMYHDNMQNEPDNKPILETHLRKALQSNEFKIFYQPKLTVSTGKISSAEALVRWNHHTLGEVNPSEFIPLAEQTGLIRTLGSMVLEHAFKQAKQWADEGLGEIRISVNLSTQQLLGSSFLEQLDELLMSHDINAHLLELELTESLLLEDVESSIRTLQAIRERGIELTIDDFGTGFSSLSYLKRLPISTVKIDQSFVQGLGLGNDEQDTTIIKTIINMAHQLNIRVVAEGVETQSQYEILTRLGCDELQGYYISSAIPARQFPEIVKQYYNHH